MRSVLGDLEVDKLRGAFTGAVPGGADLVCYWFELARLAIIKSRAQRVGLVATNSIRHGSNRHVLDEILRVGEIFAAWSDEPWTVEGADVRVSLICFSLEAQDKQLNGKTVLQIAANLGSADSNLADARRLSSNSKICFQGTIKVGPFDIDGQTARAWLLEPPNANGRSNADVIKPWRNARHVVQRFDDAWVVDFGAAMTERDASFYAKPFAHVVDLVKPMR